VSKEEILFEPITRSQLQEMTGKTIERVSVMDSARAALFVLKDKQGNKSAYGFKYSEFLEDVIISRSVPPERG